MESQKQSISKIDQNKNAKTSEKESSKYENADPQDVDQYIQKVLSMKGNESQLKEFNINSGMTLNSKR